MTIPVMAYPQLAPSEQDAYREQLSAGLDGLPTDLVSRARQLFDRLIPVQWPVEWHLPWWLGRDFDLPADDVEVLTLCNLFGLGYVRLQDAILDERASQAGRRSQRRLADALHDQAMRRLGDLFGDQAEFWGRRNEAMRQWQLALSDGEQAPARRFADWSESDFLLLAWRGAPIKITAVGACLLADRSDAVPVLLDALDHLLTAQVLLDHLDDWPADLAAGRFNAFVAFLSDLPQISQNRDANRRHVLGEFYLGEAGAAYVDLARRHIQAARRHAAAIPSFGFERYLDFYDTETTTSQLALHTQIRAWLHDATTAIFSPPHVGTSAAISS